LSGGIDSSLITAIMKRRSTGQVNSFSIGFEDDRFNEAPFAREVARHLGTNHTELTITARDSLAIVPQIASIYDEPLADSSQIPSIFLARMARSHVTVALTGDGGDEIFGGYNRYLFAPKFWRTLSRFPRTMRRRLATGFVKFEQSVRRAGYSSDGLFARFGLPTSMGDKIGFLAEVASNSNDISDVYCGLSSINPDVRAVLAQPIDDDGTSLWRSLDSLNLSDAERMILIDTLTYLPGDILTKVDRATMSASLESRAPLLDGRIIDFAWSLPLENKISGSVGKRILRRILARHVPTHLIDRPKQGFGIPLDDWLRSGLKEWASELLSPHSLDSSGLLNSGVVTGMWESHLSRRRNMGSQLWTILLLESWRRGLK
jgi:asparagine synthase (glutamine-hydrolysing)